MLASPRFGSNTTKCGNSGQRRQDSGHHSNIEYYCVFFGCCQGRIRGIFLPYTFPNALDGRT
jgi:hypothetical protein